LPRKVWLPKEGEDGNVIKWRRSDNSCCLLRTYRKLWLWKKAAVSRSSSVASGRVGGYFCLRHRKLLACTNSFSTSCLLLHCLSTSERHGSRCNITCSSQLNICTSMVSKCRASWSTKCPTASLTTCRNPKRTWVNLSTWYSHALSLVPLCWLRISV